MTRREVPNEGQNTPDERDSSENYSTGEQGRLRASASRPQEKKHENPVGSFEPESPQSREPEARGLPAGAPGTWRPEPGAYFSVQPREVGA